MSRYIFIKAVYLRSFRDGDAALRIHAFQETGHAAMPRYFDVGATSASGRSEAGRAWPAIDRWFGGRCPPYAPDAA
jgi:hypothetical protein